MSFFFFFVEKCSPVISLRALFPSSTTCPPEDMHESLPSTNHEIFRAVLAALSRASTEGIWPQGRIAEPSLEDSKGKKESKHSFSSRDKPGVWDVCKGESPEELRHSLVQAHFHTCSSGLALVLTYAGGAPYRQTHQCYPTQTGGTEINHPPPVPSGPIRFPFKARNFSIDFKRE